MIYNLVSSPWVKKVAPVALTVAAGAGVIGTAVLAAKATPKAIEARDIAEKEKGEPLTTWEKLKAMAPSYIPAGASCAVTLASIGGLALLNHRQEARLNAIIAGGNQMINQISRKYNLLRNDVQKEAPDILKRFDQKTLDDEYEAYVKERMKKIGWCWGECFPLESSEEYGEKRMFCIEYGNGLWDENGHEMIFFWATPGDVIAAFYNLNGLLQQEGIVKVNDFFRFMNLPNTDLGNKLVWDIGTMVEEDGVSFIGFNTKDIPLEAEDEVPEPMICTYIVFMTLPLAEGYSDAMGYPSQIYPKE